MRFLAISMIIIMFNLSMGIVNNVDADYVDAQNRSLYGWTGEPDIKTSDFSDYNNMEKLQTALTGLSTIDQNFVTDIIDTLQATLGLLMDFVKMLIDVIILPSANFGRFIQYLGRDPNALGTVQIISDDVALLITIFTNIIHILAIGQLMSKVNLKGVT